MPGASAPRVTHVLTEIDETLPTDDRLRAATYSAPGDMKAAGYIVAHVPANRRAGLRAGTNISDAVALRNPAWRWHADPHDGAPRGPDDCS
jgi:hypothetical protein